MKSSDREGVARREVHERTPKSDQSRAHLVRRVENKEHKLIRISLFHFNEQKQALRLYNCSSSKLMQIGYVINQYAAFASRERFEYNYKF